MNYLTQQEKTVLVKQLTECKYCKSVDGVEISHELLDDHFVVWCGCGNGTNTHDHLSDAVNVWNAQNQ